MRNGLTFLWRSYETASPFFMQSHNNTLMKLVAPHIHGLHQRMTYSFVKEVCKHLRFDFTFYLRQNRLKLSALAFPHKEPLTLLSAAVVNSSGTEPVTLGL